MGRPSKYKKEYCQMMIDFFSVPPMKKKIDRTYYQNGKIKSSKEVYVPAEFPTLQKFRTMINVNVDTLYEWSKKHKEFSEALTHARDLQDNILVVNAMNGGYNGQFAQFFAKNRLGYKDKVETEIKSEGFKVVIEDAERQS